MDKHFYLMLNFNFQEKKSDLEANIVSLLEKISRVCNFLKFWYCIFSLKDQIIVYLNFQQRKVFFRFQFIFNYIIFSIHQLNWYCLLYFRLRFKLNICRLPKISSKCRYYVWCNSNFCFVRKLHDLFFSNFSLSRFN